MRDYGKVSAQFWTGATGKALRGKAGAQLVALYLMTSPHALMTGVYHLPKLYLAHETGLTPAQVDDALAVLATADFCTYDDESEWVFVHNFVQHQVGEDLKPSDHRVTGLRKALPGMPKPLRRAFETRYGDLIGAGEGRGYQGASKGLDGAEEGASEAPSKPRAGAGAGAGALEASTPDGVEGAGRKSAVPDCPHEEILEAYHRELPACTRMQVWDERRRAMLRSRWREAPERQDVEWWAGLFRWIASDCPFLVGQSDTAHGREPFLLDLEWLVRPANFVKVIEGRYARRAA